MLGHPQRREKTIWEGGGARGQRRDGRVEDIWRGRTGGSSVRVDRRAGRGRCLGGIGFARRELIRLEAEA
jgi:hypothetical protein